MDVTELREDLREALFCFDGRLPIERSRTPPASWYTDSRFLQLEKETIFRDHWLFACRLDQLQQPGDYVTGAYLGRPFVVTRDKDNRLNAFYNLCSHHGTQVAEGEGRVATLVCPYHGWTYGLNGKLKSARRAGAIHCREKSELGLKPLRVATWGAWVLLHFGEPAASLERSFKGLDRQRGRLGLAGFNFCERVAYPIDCNWKVFVDNYLDGGYHVPMLHRDLAAGLDIASYRSEIGDCFSVQTCLARGGERLGDEAIYLWIYPNMMINRYGDWMDTNLVLPLAANRCLVVFDYFCRSKPAKEQLVEAMSHSAKVQQEDTEISLKVQAGLESGVYQRGVYAPRFEKPMYHFHQLLAADLGGMPVEA